MATWLFGYELPLLATRTLHPATVDIVGTSVRAALNIGIVTACVWSGAMGQAAWRSSILNISRSGSHIVIIWGSSPEIIGHATSSSADPYRSRLGAAFLFIVVVGVRANG